MPARSFSTSENTPTSRNTAAPSQAERAVARSASHDDEPRSSNRGRTAQQPGEVPRPGWKDIIWRTRQQLSEDNLTIVSAGIAFYAFVAVVPALAAVIATYGLIADPHQVEQHLASLARIAPPNVMPLLEEQLARIVANERAAGWGALVGVVLALYSSAKGAKALIQGLNIAYDEKEQRHFLKLNAVALTITFLGVFTVIVLLGLIAVLPAVLAFAGLQTGAESIVAWLRWPIAIGMFMLGLSAIYRFGPCRETPRWKWVSWGAGLSTVLWLAASAAFSLYVSNFGSYDKTYGSLGAVVVFLLWLHLTSFVVLLGAELNAEMERQTREDTTSGEPAPLGNRGAYAADTVGPTHPKHRE